MWTRGGSSRWAGTGVLAGFLVLGLASVGCGGGGGGRGRKGTVPVQPDLPPLPDYVEVCVSKAIVLPAKMDGHAWDGVGRANRKARKMIPELVAASQGGGYAAAMAVAGDVGTTLFNKVKGPPDLRVRMQLGRPMIIRTDMIKDSAIAAFGATEASCAVIEKKEYVERVRFFVEDLDVGRPEIVGSTSFVGIPEEALRTGSWTVYGFDSVVEIELTLQPMRKPEKPRQELVPETEPPSGPPDEEAPSGGEDTQAQAGALPDPFAAEGG